jgi:hypothetical protein
MASDRRHKIDEPRSSQTPAEFERILMDSSYVKRVGQGYQSNIGGPVGANGPIKKRKSAYFFTTLRRQKTQNMPEAAVHDNDFGLLHQAEPIPVASDQEKSLNLVRRAVRVVLGTNTLSTKKSRTF